MTLRIVSDLHLKEERPDIVQAFFRYCENLPEDTTSLYLLGDIFEAWIGDDDPREISRAVVAQLRSLSDKGIKLFFQHGNRDFLVSNGFAEETGCTLLDEYAFIEHAGMRYLINHGDSLCIDDVDYHAFKSQFRTDDNIAFILSKTLPERVALAKQLREKSMQANADKDLDIMDVNEDEVARVMREYKVDKLIHGHTHRPNTHNYNDGRQRIVLGDWDAQGWEVIIDDNGAQLVSFDLS